MQLRESSPQAEQLTEPAVLLGVQQVVRTSKERERVLRSAIHRHVIANHWLVRRPSPVAKALFQYEPRTLWLLGQSTTSS